MEPFEYEEAQIKLNYERELFNFELDKKSAEQELTKDAIRTLASIPQYVQDGEVIIAVNKEILRRIALLS